MISWDPGRGLDRFINTDLDISAVPLVAVPACCPEAVEVPPPLLFPPIERFQSLDKALHAKTGGILVFVRPRTNDCAAMETDSLHFSCPVFIGRCDLFLHFLDHNPAK